MNNPPAFPNEGMTLRDYFAAAALPEIYSLVMHGDKDVQTLGADYIANCSYILADAMLKAREQ